jgi:hypothetical protein
MKNYAILSILLLAFPCFAQVGIGTTTPKATLEIKSTNETAPASTDGILIPKINNFPATNPTANQHGMLIWYSNTTNPALEGFYYWNHTQTKWIPLFSSEKGWSLTGNASTTDDHFVGTTDDKPLRFRVNNQPAGEITTTSDNVSLGINSLPTTTTGSGNIALGSNSLEQNTTGVYNTAIGLNALLNNTVGHHNTAIGRATLYSNTTGLGNIAIGNNALFKNTVNNSNLAIGTSALYELTDGEQNLAIGAASLRENISGSKNVGVGYGAAHYNITGSRNVAIGNSSSYFLAHGNDNVAVGAYSCGAFSNTFPNSASENVMIGSYAGYHTYDGNRNSILGYNALYQNYAGNHNVAMGDHALYNVSTSGNTALGSGALMNLTTGTNNTAIGFQAGRNLPATVTNTTSIGNGAGFATTTSNQINVGNFSVTWIGGATNWATYSDARIKENIQHNVPGLAFIKELKPVTYNLNTSKQYEIANLGKKDESDDWEGKHDIEQIKQTGFLAQEVAQAAQKLGYDFNGVYAPKNGQGLYSLSYATFVVPLVKAVQEQQQQIESLTKQNQQLELRLQQLEQLVNKISNNN